MTYAYQTKHYRLIFPAMKNKVWTLIGFTDASHKEKRGITGYVVGIIRDFYYNLTSMTPTPEEQEVKQFQFFPLAWKSVFQPYTLYSSMGAEIHALIEGVSVAQHVARLL